MNKYKKIAVVILIILTGAVIAVLGLSSLKKERAKTGIAPAFSKNTRAGMGGKQTLEEKYFLDALRYIREIDSSAREYLIATQKAPEKFDDLDLRSLPVEKAGGTTLETDRHTIDLHRNPADPQRYAINVRGKNREYSLTKTNDLFYCSAAEEAEHLCKQHSRRPAEFDPELKRWLYYF